MPDASVSLATAPAAGGSPAYLVITGQTNSGKKFRPSDWSDRLHSTLRALGDEADYYADFVHLVNIYGDKCLMLDLSLENQNALLYNFFLNFARDNNLATRAISNKDWEDLRDSP